MQHHDPTGFFNKIFIIKYLWLILFIKIKPVPCWWHFLMQTLMMRNNLFLKLQSGMALAILKYKWRTFFEYFSSDLIVFMIILGFHFKNYFCNRKPSLVWLQFLPSQKKSFGHTSTLWTDWWWLRPSLLETIWMFPIDVVVLVSL